MMAAAACLTALRVALVAIESTLNTHLLPRDLVQQKHSNLFGGGGSVVDVDQVEVDVQFGPSVQQSFRWNHGQ